MTGSTTARRSPATRARDFIRFAPLKIGYFHGPRLMSELRKRWVLLRHPHATIEFGDNVYLGPGFSLDIRGPGSFIVGDNVEFRRNFRAEIAGAGRIEIGSGSYLTYDVILACSTAIEIGERCGLGQATFVADGNHRYRDLDKAFLSQGYDFKPITIEDDAQIHSKCTIVADIGHRAVIGANAVVSRPIPPYTLAVGVPARPIDYFGPPGGEPAGLPERSSRDGG
jgi:acetyltransferase-like isoleucine patch superfamily enzyme